jgi:hypothetical protein
MKLTYLFFFAALVFISAGFAFENYWLSLLGGAIYGLSVHNSRKAEIYKLSIAVHKAGLTREFNELLQRVQEINNG